jgi:hypothetical protein
VNGQREEILPLLDRLGGGDCAQNHGFAERRHDGAVGLAGNAARFELQRLSAELDFHCLYIEHFRPFARRPDAVRGHQLDGLSGPSAVGAFFAAPERPAELRDMSINEAAPIGAAGTYFLRPSLAMRSV